MPNVYFAGLFAVLIVLGLGGAYVKGRSDGTAITTSIYAQRDVKAAADYQAKETALQEAYRAKEAKWTQSLAAVSKDYQRKVAANETQRLADIAAIDARTIRLRDPNAADNQACGDKGAIPAASAAGHNGSAGAYLPNKTAAFLLGLATEADSVTVQLTACQAVLASERQ